MPKRILLLYISEASGHHSATLAIEKAINQIDSSAQVFNINSFSFTNPLIERITNRMYMGIIKKMPRIWGFLYDNPKIAKTTERIKDRIHRSNYEKIKSLLDTYRPDVIACSQAFPCGMVADYKKAFNVTTPLVGVLTDYASHAYWFYDHVDYYVVATEESRQRFIREGVDADTIKLFGIPIDPKFIQRHDRTLLADKFGIDLDIPVILLMGGSRGMGPLKKMINLIDKLDIPLQVIAVTGANKPLERWLRKRQVSAKKKLIVFGYAPNIDELMEIATLIITKPGGLTTAEALAKGVPMVIIRPIPGQEMNNTEYLLKKGAAININHIEQLIPALKDILAKPQVLLRMKTTVRELAHPESALHIADLLLSVNG